MTRPLSDGGGEATPGLPTAGLDVATNELRDDEGGPDAVVTTVIVGMHEAPLPLAFGSQALPWASSAESTKGRANASQKVNRKAQETTGFIERTSSRCRCYGNGHCPVSTENSERNEEKASLRGVGFLTPVFLYPLLIRAQ